MKSDRTPGSQLSLDIFAHSPAQKPHGSHVPGLLRSSPDGTPLQLRRAMFLKNVKKKGEKASFESTDPENVPLLNRITNGTNGIIT